MHAPIKEESNDLKDCFYEESEQVSDHLHKYHMKILLGLLTQKWGEKIFSNRQHNSNDNGAGIINTATSKNLSRARCPVQEHS